MKSGVWSWFAVVVITLAGWTTSASAALQDDGTACGNQSTALDGNDAGEEVGACLPPAGSGSAPVVAIAVVPGHGEVTLPPLVQGKSCAAEMVSSTGVIGGTCLDSNDVAQGVTWSSYTATPLQLQPVGALLGGGVKTVLTAMNAQGLQGGESLDGSNVATPVIWSGTTAHPLPGAALLGLGNTNCKVIDIADNTGWVTGTCPNGTGRAAAILWTSAGGGYLAHVLTPPSDASQCVPTRVNGAGQVLASCHRANGNGSYVVRFESNGRATPLASVNGSTNIQAVDMNATGQVAFDVLNANGFKQAGFWNPPDPSSAQMIPSASGGARSEAVGIGNNGTVAVNAETGTGDWHAETWSLAGGTVDLGALDGNNSFITSISPGGGVIAGGSEVAGEAIHAIVGP
ncbi:hypothetical protein [Burkholderia ambifaria]|uniref:hypothetical protein n=1 Tax=Burkholderia ambifaria TaxID=152480 RepID=UPI001590BC8E|nr:hypothetical protein [Burkholderia ambifaria]